MTKSRESWVDEQFADDYPPHWNGAAYPGQRQSGGAATDPERPSKLAQKLVCLHPGEPATQLTAAPPLAEPPLSDELQYPTTLAPELRDEEGLQAFMLAIMPPTSHRIGEIMQGGETQHVPQMGRGEAVLATDIPTGLIYATGTRGLRIETNFAVDPTELRRTTRHHATGIIDGAFAGNAIGEVFDWRTHQPVGHPSAIAKNI